MIGIGDFDGAARKRRDVCTREGQRLFMGRKYSIEKETGYLTCTSGKRQRLHVAMWEQAAGREVPPGCVIHHLDWDKTHNEINNLVCVTVEEHNLIHNPPVGYEGLCGKELGYELAAKRNNKNNKNKTGRRT